MGSPMVGPGALSPPAIPDVTIEEIAMTGSPMTGPGALLIWGNVAGMRMMGLPREGPGALTILQHRSKASLGIMLCRGACILDR